MQRADQIVVRFLRLVVERRALLQQCRQSGRRQRSLFLELGKLLGQPDQVAAVAVGHGEQRLPARLVDRELTAQSLLDPRHQGL